MFDQDEPFCNPIAPVDHQEPNQQQQTIQKQNLSNEDFRKLAMTPSANRAFGDGSTPAFGLKGSASVRGNRRQVIMSDGFKKPQSTVPLSEAAAERKKNKKKYHQKKKEDDDEDSLTEIMKNYRDRAKERRDNKNEEEEQLITMGNYNAVANLTNEDAAERRKQLIEESKYLGGDMEHTHLVKGLDYALLQKVKAEIEFKRDEETLELVKNELEKHENDTPDDEENNEEDWEIKSPLAKNLMTILFENNLPERNDYFLPGRLAYVFDLENDCPSDAFTSVIRSKAECPNWDQLNTLSTNDIVINKLIEIFEELREQGGRRKKKLKPETTKSDDNSKFNFINSFGTNKSINGSPSRNESSKLNRSIESADLNSIYDQELNVESIIKNSKAKVENDLNIYDDLDDYVLPHKLEKDDRKRRDDRYSSSSRYDDKYDDRKYNRDHERRYNRDRYYHDKDYDRERRRRSTSRERHHYSSSSDEERYKYKDNYSKKRDHHERSRTPDRYHSSSSFSKRKRY